MKTIVNTNNINFKLQTFLFAFSILMHVAATSVKAEHPLLSCLLAMLETVGWITILTTWVIALIKGIQYGRPKLWTKVWTYARKHVHIKKAKNNDTFVSIEQLKHLRNNIDRLGLALHGVTPEMEQARRTHFQMLGEAIPAPILPVQNATLYAEFNSLTRFLNHFGFPNLESVRFQHKDLEFAQKWGSDLEARLQQAQRNYVYEQQALEWMMSEACNAFEHIGTQYPLAQDDAGYQRVQGALRLLKKMARNSHFPSEQMTSYFAALMEDMEGLHKQLKQAA